MPVAEQREVSFFDSFRIQCRVVGALMMRELHTRYGRENIGYLWLFLEPMLLASMISLLHARGGHAIGGDIKPVPLSLIGYCNFMMFRGMMTRAESVLHSNVTLLYHRTITILDLQLASALLDAFATFIAFSVLIAVAISFGIAEPPQRPLMFLFGVVLMLLLSLGIAMVICGLTYGNRSIGRLVHPLTYIMMPLSGAFFTMAQIPGPVRDLILTIPLAHVFELLRYGWFESATAEYISPMYLGGWIMGMWFVGLLLISIVRQRIHMP